MSGSTRAVLIKYTPGITSGQRLCTVKKGPLISSVGAGGVIPGETK